RRYRHLVEQTLRTLPESINLAGMSNAETAGTAEHSFNSGNASNLVQRQLAHGVTREEVDVLIKPMISEAHEAVGSMGDDTPPAVLSSRSRLFTDYFRQRFAQVTNPPVDPY